MGEQEYISPDRQLRLLVTSPDGDVTIGFAGCPAHTHGSILADLFQCDEAEAVRRFVSDIVQSRVVIAIWRTGGQLKDIWLPEHEGQTLRDEIARLARHGEPRDTIEFRLWDGTKIAPD
jgi:hypothetical protein